MQGLIVDSFAGGGGAKHALVAAFLAKHYGGHETPGASVETPFSVVTAKDHHALVTSHLMHFKGSCRDGRDQRDPMWAVEAEGGKIAEVRAFLAKYYGTGGQDQDVREPLHTVPTKARFAIVTVAGVDYAIADIGMRMLTPRELFRAQGFPDSYRIDGLTKTAQIRMCGNSVVPHMAAALVRANVAPAVPERAAA